MMIFNNTQEQAIKELARYKFLTISQFSELLGMGKNWIRDELKKIVSIDLVGVTTYGVIPKFGRLESMYYLTPKGAKIVTDNFDIKLPQYAKHDVKFTNEYFHHLWTVQSCISMDKFLSEYSGTLFNRYLYFNRTGKTNHQSTRLEFKGGYLNPDILMSYQLGEKTYNFLFELYNLNNTKEIVKKTIDALKAIYEKSPQNKLGVNKTARLLLVFQDEGTMLATMERLQPELVDFEAVDRIILAKSSQTMKEDFARHWVDLNGVQWDLTRLGFKVLKRRIFRVRTSFKKKLYLL